jgi:hypothetical protein
LLRARGGGVTGSFVQQPDQLDHALELDGVPTVLDETAGDRVHASIDVDDDLHGFQAPAPSGPAQ